MSRAARTRVRVRAGLRALRVLWHLPNFIRLYWRLYRDPRVPLAAKAGLTAAVLYVISPIDLIPDYWFPLIGFADDAGVLWIASRWFITACPPAVVTEHVRRIDRERHAGRRRS